MLTVNIYNEGSRIMFIFFCMVFVFQTFCSKHALLLWSAFMFVCMLQFLRDFLLSVDLFTLKCNLLEKQILSPKEWPYSKTPSSQAALASRRNNWGGQSFLLDPSCPHHSMWEGSLRLKGWWESDKAAKTSQAEETIVIKVQEAVAMPLIPNARKVEESRGWEYFQDTFFRKGLISEEKVRKNNHSSLKSSFDLLSSTDPRDERQKEIQYCAGPHGFWRHVSSTLWNCSIVHCCYLAPIEYSIIRGILPTIISNFSHHSEQHY